MPYLLYHGASVYNGHLRGPVTLTPIAERLAVEPSLPAFKTVAAGIRTPNNPLATALNHCTTAVVPIYVEDRYFKGFIFTQKVFSNTVGERVW